jgi:limonene-1,2-epoxide hydrolase
MTPKEIVIKYIDAFNDADISGMTELYSDDAINHQVMFEPVIGKKEIKKMLERDFGLTKMACIVENIFGNDEWITLEWKEPLGLRGCEIFHIVNEKIQLQRGYWDRLAFNKEHNIS